MTRKLYRCAILFVAASVGNAVAALPATTFNQHKLAGTTVASVGPKNPRQFAVFMNKVIRTNMKELHVPGVVFVVVQDGAVFFMSGYGFSNIKSQTPVTPNRTLFRAGSVSKVLTVTALLQLSERGLLTLDDDINSHLRRFQVRSSFAEPITPFHLITHTAGFDGKRIGLATLRRDEYVPLGEFLEDTLPTVIRAPGKYYSYSRYGIALAGHLVEEISGMPFSKVVDENILKPMDMMHSGFELPDSLASLVASGYHYENGRFHSVPFHYFQTAPEASFNTTGEDMARFMIAHLQKGVYKERRLLREDTVERMHKRNFAHHPKLPGVALGFYERLENGQRAIQHGGHIPGFVSRMLLLPDHNLGFFIACNSDRFKLISEVTESFFERCIATKETPIDTVTSARYRTELSRFSGYYLASESARSGIEKAFSAIKQIRITNSGNRFLKIAGKRWMPDAPLLFRRQGTETYSAFQEDSTGAITHLYDKRFALEKLGFFESLPFQGFAFVIMALIFVSAITFWPGCYVLGRRDTHIARSAPIQIAYRLAGSTAILNLVFMLGFLFLLARVDSYIDFTFGIPVYLKLLLCFPLISGVTALLMLVQFIRCSGEETWSLPRQLHHGLIGITSIAFIVFLNHWYLLGFRF